MKERGWIHPNSGTALSKLIYWYNHAHHFSPTYPTDPKGNSSQVQRGLEGYCEDTRGIWKQVRDEQIKSQEQDGLTVDLQSCILPINILYFFIGVIIQKKLKITNLRSSCQEGNKHMSLLYHFRLTEWLNWLNAPSYQNIESRHIKGKTVLVLLLLLSYWLPKWILTDVVCRGCKVGSV